MYCHASYVLEMRPEAEDEFVISVASFVER
jgi:hypothetical protein